MEKKYLYGALLSIPKGEVGKKWLRQEIKRSRHLRLYDRILNDSMGGLFYLTAPQGPYTFFFMDHERKAENLYKGMPGKTIIPIFVSGKEYHLLSVGEGYESLLKYLDNYEIQDDREWI